MTSVTKSWAFGLVVLTTLLITVAQFLLKTGLAQWPALFTNVPLLIGVGLYALGSVIMILAFKGGEVSTLYPVIATSYLWVALLSHFVLHEDVHLFRWIGVIVIVAGIMCIGLGGRNQVSA